MPEHEGPQGVEFDGQQRGEVSRIVAVEELHALHQQRPEQLLPQCRQHLRRARSFIVTQSPEIAEHIGNPARGMVHSQRSSGKLQALQLVRSAAGLQMAT